MGISSSWATKVPAWQTLRLQYLLFFRRDEDNYKALSETSQIPHQANHSPATEVKVELKQKPLKDWPEQFQQGERHGEAVWRQVEQSVPRSRGSAEGCGGTSARTKWTSSPTRSPTEQRSHVAEDWRRGGTSWLWQWRRSLPLDVKDQIHKCLATTVCSQCLWPILMAFKLADNRTKLQKVGHPEGAFRSWGESREICLYVIWRDCVCCY